MTGTEAVVVALIAAYSGYYFGSQRRRDDLLLEGKVEFYKNLISRLNSIESIMVAAVVFEENHEFYAEHAKFTLLKQFILEHLFNNGTHGFLSSGEERKKIMDFLPTLIDAEYERETDKPSKKWILEVLPKLHDLLEEVKKMAIDDCHPSTKMIWDLQPKCKGGSEA